MRVGIVNFGRNDNPIKRSEAIFLGKAAGMRMFRTYRYETDELTAGDVSDKRRKIA